MSAFHFGLCTCGVVFADAEPRLCPHSAENYYPRSYWFCDQGIMTSLCSHSQWGMSWCSSQPWEEACPDHSHLLGLLLSCLSAHPHTSTVHLVVTSTNTHSEWVRNPYATKGTGITWVSQIALSLSQPAMWTIEKGRCLVRNTKSSNRVSSDMISAN